MLRVDAASSRELQAVILGLRRATTEVRKQVRQHTKRMAQPEWQKSVREHGNTRLEQRVFGATARAFPSDQNVRLSAAGIGKPLRGGIRPAELWPAVEFGADREKRTTYHARRGGRLYSVTRRTRHALRPRNRSGYVVYPAAKQMIPRIVSLWMQTTVRTFHEALEGKS